MFIVCGACKVKGFLSLFPNPLEDENLIDSSTDCAEVSFVELSACGMSRSGEPTQDKPGEHV